MRAMFSPDGAQWIYADAFGVTRVGLGEKIKVGKHTMKAACAAHGALSLDATGERCMVAPGRYQTKSGGWDGWAMVSLPTSDLGLRGREDAPAGLMTSALHDRVLTLVGAQLLVNRIDADALAVERAVALDGAPPRGELVLGPPPPPLSREARPLLCVMPDGRFVALMSDRVFQAAPGQPGAWQVAPRWLYAGKIGADAQADEVWWRASLLSAPTADTSLAMVGEEVWVTVMDHTTDTAHIAHLTREGVITTHALPALAPPAFTATHILYQPTSAEVRRRALGTGVEQAFDVGYHNAHPRPDHGDEVYKGAPRPAPPTRLPGHLAANDKRMFFVPWHGEFIVDLAAGVAHERGLRPAAGALRRLMSTLLAHHNQSLRQLNCQLKLDGFDHDAARTCSSMALTMPGLPDQLVSAAATNLLHCIHDRYMLEAGGWRGGGMLIVGGLPHLSAPIDVAQICAALDWMRGAGLTPLDELAPLAESYRRAYGLSVSGSQRFDGYGDACVLSGDAERLYLRAMLETLRGGWPADHIPASWADEPITPQRALDAAEALVAWPTERLGSSGCALLTMMLTVHLGEEAIPWLLVVFGRDGSHALRVAAGERLAWLAARSPQLKAQLHAAISAVDIFAGSSASHQIDYCKRGLLESLDAIN